MSGIDSRLAALERLQGDAGGLTLPAFIYHTDDTDTAEALARKQADAFSEYKERWQDDSRYSKVLERMQSYNQLEAYLEARGQANYIVNVVFVHKPAEVSG